MSSAPRKLFVARLCQNGAADSQAVDEQLQAILDRVHRRWSTFRLEDEAFVAFLADRLPPDADGLEPLERLNVEDLYLTCGCAQGEPQAIAAFEQLCLPYLEPALARIGASPAAIDDLRGSLTADLMVSRRPGVAPLICSFSGRGKLRNWVQAVAVRAYLRRNARRKPEDPADDTLLERLSPGDDPELAHLKQTYRADFRQAFEEALRSLEGRPSLVLHQHYVDGLTLDQLARLYDVHRVTAARWLVKARETLYQRTRQNLMRRLRITPAECDSIIRLLDTQIARAVESGFLVAPGIDESSTDEP